MSENKSNLICHGGVGEVTGSNFLLEKEVEGKTVRILVDCGMHQGTHESSNLNAEMFAYEPASIDVLLVTHAHADHIGLIPKLVKAGFRGAIYSTPETKMLAAVMFDDMVSLNVRKAKEKGTLPLYEKQDAAAALSMWQTASYGETLSLPGGITALLKDAGHILGSTMYELTSGKGSILFTGDLGNTPSPLLKDTESPGTPDYMVVESVYGDRNHEPQEERRGKLQQAILDTIQKQGVLIIPAFSIERTQVILYEINNMVEENAVPSLPVFLDSPLAIKVTDIYQAMRHNFNAGVQGEMAGGDDIFNFPKLQFTASPFDSKHIEQTKSPKIIIAGSGMSEGGRVIHHERKYLSDPNTILLLVGYQALGTMGRLLQDGAREVTIEGEKIPVRADIRIIHGYSSHKDSDHLLEFVDSGRKKLKRVFVAMGEPRASLFLVQRIRDYLDLDAIMPERGKTYEIEF